MKTKVDTSTTLVSNTQLVGNWQVVTDTISVPGNTIMYHGTAYDQFKFTKYGNLYISVGLEHLIDTAVYSITSITNQVSWVNSYVSVNGQSTTIASTTGPYTITSVDTASLVLTSNVQTPGGIRYEQIKFKK